MKQLAAPTKLRDSRNNALGTAVRSAAEHAETALWQMMSFADTPWSELDRAQAADPDWALPRIMKAGYQLGSGEPALVAPALALLDEAEAGAQASERETLHLQALRAAADGRWPEACRLWGDWLLEHPRDALALQWAQQWDHLRGDSASLRWRPARALPEWSEDDPLYPHVLGLYAFGLEENNLYPQAEEAGRRAVAAGGCVPWAVHAVAHVMEMQGRFEDGTAWLRQHQPGWDQGQDLAGHLWWHMGLFRLEALDFAGVQRLIDAHLSGTQLQCDAQRLDAAALLWRLHLMGHDVGARYALMLADWAPDPELAGDHAFRDLHVLIAMLGADELLRAEHWIARCAARAMRAEGLRRSNHALAREVGLPLMRGLLAYARGQDAQALSLIQAVLPLCQRLGGSHAQRDLVDQTLLAAASRSGPAPIGRALLNQRLMAKPATPLTRFWAERLKLQL